MNNSSEKFCFQWNDFHINTVSSYQQLRKNGDFSDVTLVCDEDQQTESHRIILSASSPFFNSVLKRNKHSHPMIYMRGLKANILAAVLDFIYHGQANIYQEDLDGFLKLAGELQLKGLDLSHDEDLYPPEDPEKSNQSQSLPIIRQEMYLQPEVKKSNIVDRDNMVVVDGDKMLVAADSTIEDVRIKLDSLMERAEGRENLWKCTVCGKETKGNGARKNMRGHIETHMEGLSYSCKQCDKVSR